MRWVLSFLWLFLCSPAFAQEKEALPRLRVDQNRLVAPDGTPVTLRGVSLCSLTWHNPLRLLTDLVQRKEGWHVNVVRLPVQPAEWEKLGPEAFIKERLDPAVQKCRHGGVYCIIDWHEIAAWNDPQTARKLEAFWRVVAPRYAGHVFILYEIFNEPTRPSGLNRENWLAFRARAQRWVDIIRKKAPDTVLLIGSPHWSQMPSFAERDPLRGHNLLYSLHLYSGWPPDTWDRLFGDAAHHVPLFISEWGWSSRWSNLLEPFFGTRLSYAESLRAYLDARPQINWTAWSYDPACGPAMTGKDSDMGVFVRDWLRAYR